MSDPGQPIMLHNSHWQVFTLKYQGAVQLNMLLHDFETHQQAIEFHCCPEGQTMCREQATDVEGVEKVIDDKRAIERRIGAKIYSFIFTKLILYITYPQYMQ